VVNIGGRRIAESKDECKRTNMNNVDLNRNWPYEFGTACIHSIVVFMVV